MSHYVTQAGVQRAHVRADTAYFYSPVQTAELRKVHITFYDPRGAETSTLTAREGTYHWRSRAMEAGGEPAPGRAPPAPPPPPRRGSGGGRRRAPRPPPPPPPAPRPQRAED